MSDKIKAEHLYMRYALSEALRVITKDRGPEYVDEMIEAIFQANNVQKIMLSAFDKMLPNDIDFNGRAAVLKALGAAKEYPEPLV
ncbi:hypothetical protein LQT97_00525 [Brucella pseudogrignonensis]|uniref:hypothetical protein n=1 Tax=Brucella pseudogrignonensis TaxID=419475 RepID=UPI001E634444|nr:hypothetical protein [Brucella pseudogrignonensis]MCD4509708.1 hypothetical protein [Brucella pseudogrignonensis]UKK94989.1 hypothetical protein L7D45_14660 [Brucella pseudogrignonensis]